MHSDILANRVYKLKETEKGVKEIGMPIEQIAQVVKMTVEVVQGWIEESIVVIK